MVYLFAFLLFLLPASPSAQAGFCDWAYGKVFPAPAHQLARITQIQGEISRLEHSLTSARAAERTRLFARLDKLWNKRAKLGEGYRTVPLRRRFAGEHNPHVAAAIGEKTVHYFAPAERRAYEVTIGTDGRLRRADGSILDTSDGRTFRPAIFVMDADGRIFVYDGPRVIAGKAVKHSSLLAGAPVAAAGELKVRDGKVILASSWSGHYHPGKRIFRQFLTELEKKAAPIPETTSRPLW